MNPFNIFIKLEFYKNRQLVFYTPAFFKESTRGQSDRAFALYLANLDSSLQHPMWSSEARAGVIPEHS